MLSYNANDYKSIGDGISPSTQLVQGLGGGYKPLYNGNIAAMGVSIARLNQPMVYNYGYDVLNRMVTMDAFTCAAGWQTLQPALNGAYAERVAYDPNGNIKSYQRNGTSSQPAMDDLHYNYYALTNQLSQITDPTPASNYPNDIDGQSINNYYQYDPIGNLIQEGDNTSGNTISWNVYGKIQQVVKHGTGASTITYSYDASGNRISKTTSTTTTYYVRDASGNVMAVYEGTSSQMKVTETDLYGSNRLGLVSTQTVATVEQTVSGFGTVRTLTFTRGEKSYELSNHLGNVLSTISDRRQQMPVNSTVSYYIAEITSATDYYPFGMQMPGRTVSSSSYRYGFNGKEMSDEINGSGVDYDYGFRIYDTRIGRFLSVDPLTKSYPYYTPYQFAGNMPICAIDLDGLEQYIVIHYMSRQHKTYKIEIHTIKVGTELKDQNFRRVTNEKTEGSKIALGNVLVFEIYNAGTRSEQLKVVNTLNKPDSKLTDEEANIYKTRNRLIESGKETQNTRYVLPNTDNEQYGTEDFKEPDFYTASKILPLTVHGFTTFTSGGFKSGSWMHGTTTEGVSNEFDEYLSRVKESGDVKSITVNLDLYSDLPYNTDAVAKIKNEYKKHISQQAGVDMANINVTGDVKKGDSNKSVVKIDVK